MLIWTKSRQGGQIQMDPGTWENKRHQHLRVPGVRLLMEMINIAITTAVLKTMPICACVEDRFVSDMKCSDSFEHLASEYSIFRQLFNWQLLTLNSQSVDYIFLQNASGHSDLE